MTWEPKNKTDDDDDAMLSDDDKEKDDLDGPHHAGGGHMDKQRDHKGKVNLPFFTFILHLWARGNYGTYLHNMQIPFSVMASDKLPLLLAQYGTTFLLSMAISRINIIVVRIIPQQQL